MPLIRRAMVLPFPTPVRRLAPSAPARPLWCNESEPARWQRLQQALQEAGPQGRSAALQQAMQDLGCDDEHQTLLALLDRLLHEAAPAPQAYTLY